jgi:signal transduction histidine kinase
MSTLESIMKVKPMSPDRRKNVRRNEDHWKMRHTDALESLLSDLAYDVRNILVVVPALTEELREDIGKIVEAAAQEQQEFMERWSDALKFISDKAQQLVDRTKQVGHHTKASQCPLKTLVEEVLKSWGSIAERKGVQIECQGLENLPTVSAYEWRLRTIVFPPITRAIEVTPSGGLVKVSGRVDQVQKLAIIEVKDGGASVPFNMREAFNRGDQLDTAEQSMHKAWDVLNLQEARRIGGIHGCRISISNGEGVGTTCSIYIRLDNPANFSASE